MINENYPYALWVLTLEDPTWRVFKTYKTVKQLAKGWEKHVAVTSIQARANVEGVWYDISDQMPARVLKEYRSAEERDTLIIEGAEYFTVVRFLGVGQYERHRCSDLKEATTLSENLSKQNRANYMVYAVSPSGRSAFVKSNIFQSRG